MYNPSSLCMLVVCVYTRVVPPPLFVGKVYLKIVSLVMHRKKNYSKVSCWRKHYLIWTEKPYVELLAYRARERETRTGSYIHQLSRINWNLQNKGKIILSGQRKEEKISSWGLLEISALFLSCQKCVNLFLLLSIHHLQEEGTIDDKHWIFIHSFIIINIRKKSKV